MKKGVIIKLNKNKATLLADDCSFCDIKAFKGMYEGMEICYEESDLLKRKYSFIYNRTIQAACFILVIFCSYIFLSFYQENIAAYAYVGIDINPGIEMTLNKKGNIIDVRGLDEEGKNLAKQINIKQMNSIDGIKEIIEKTIDLGYLTEQNSNDITIYAITDQKNKDIGNELAEKLKSAVKEKVAFHKINNEVNAIVSDKKTKEIADKAGLSVSKYMKEEEKIAAFKNEKEIDKSIKDIIKEEKKIEKEVEKEVEKKIDSSNKGKEDKEINKPNINKNDNSFKNNKIEKKIEEINNKILRYSEKKDMNNGKSEDQQNKQQGKKNNKNKGNN